MNQMPDRQLAEACRRGDDGAWQVFVDRFGRRIYAVAYHFTLQRDDAEELTQEIFLKAFENLHRYNGAYPLAAWLLSLARNLCIDHYRRHKRERSFRHISDEVVLPLLPAADDPVREAIDRERTKMLLAAIRELPEDLAEILILRDLDGISYEEIGGALDLPDGTVKSRLFRARAEVARILRQRHENRSTAAPVISLALAAAGLS